MDKKSFLGIFMLTGVPIYVENSKSGERKFPSDIELSAVSNSVISSFCCWFQPHCEGLLQKGQECDSQSQEAHLKYSAICKWKKERGRRIFLRASQDLE